MYKVNEKYYYCIFVFSLIHLIPLGARMAFMLPVSLNIPYSLLVMHLWASNCVQCNASVVCQHKLKTLMISCLSKGVSLRSSTPCTSLYRSTVIQTLVSLRSRFMRCTLFSMAVGLVISVAQLAGNQPLSPSRILSP